jgi:hypothetical protein
MLGICAEKTREAFDVRRMRSETVSTRISPAQAR